MFVKQHNGRFHHLSQGLNHARAYVVDFIQRQQGCTDGPDAAGPRRTSTTRLYILSIGSTAGATHMGSCDAIPLGWVCCTTVIGSRQRFTGHRHSPSL